MTDNKSSDADRSLFATAVASPVTKIYVNGFILGQSLSDVTVICQTNGTPSAVLNMSFTTAKSFAFEMEQIIKKFENVTGHTLLTIEDIKKRMEV